MTLFIAFFLKWVFTTILYIPVMSMLWFLRIINQHILVLKKPSYI
ncbi:hypothetical protein BvCmsHHNP029_01765 [Escherichia coli]|nr:hypothetical protein BvCmsHHNP029_01765 [Escherichia coli]